MSTQDAARDGKAGSKYRQDFYSNQIIPKYAAYGKQLAERIRFKNPPKLVVIEVGGDSWNRAKKWAKHPDFAALVLTHEHEPRALVWPVFKCTCLIEWSIAAPERLIIELVSCLLKAGAAFVSVIPLFVDFNTPSETFDVKTQSWIRARERIRTYYPRKEGA